MKLLVCLVTLGNAKRPQFVIINSDVIIGSNCNIHKGVTTGEENNGGRIDVPTIGNNIIKK